MDQWWRRGSCFLWISQRKLSWYNTHKWNFTFLPREPLKWLDSVPGCSLSHWSIIYHLEKYSFLMKLDSLQIQLCLSSKDWVCFQYERKWQFDWKGNSSRMQPPMCDVFRGTNEEDREEESREMFTQNPLGSTEILSEPKKSWGWKKMM